MSFAGFSRVAHSAEFLADAFVRAFGLVMACTVPACVLLATLAEPLIRLVYGPRWTAAAQVLIWLAILGLLRVAYDLIYDFLAAAGKRPSLLAVQGWWLAALIPVLLIGARDHGIVGVGAGHVVVAGPLVVSRLSVGHVALRGKGARDSGGLSAAVPRRDSHGSPYASSLCACSVKVLRALP